MMEELPFAHNTENAKNIYHKLKNAIYEALFDLNWDQSIYIANESEASYLARDLAINCCNVLDRTGHINWKNFDHLDRKVPEQ